MDAGNDPYPSEAIATLRRSLIVEAAAAFAILALVSWFGTLDPFGGEAM
jgi:putative copper resistance protein D